MAKIVLAADEWDNLMKSKRDAPYKLMQEKSEALMMLHEDVPVPVVARLVGREPSTVEQWVRDWKKFRQGSIHTGHAGNLNASKLTAEQRDEVVGVLSAPPSEHEGLPPRFWSVPDLADWVYDHFEVVYESPQSYHFLLHMAGLSYHRPDPCDQRRSDEEQIDARMEQIRDQIAADLAEPDTLVYACDEVRLEHEAIIRRGWIPKGEKVKIEVDRQRKSTSYIGFLDQNTGAVELMDITWQNAESIIDALTKLTERYPEKKITIVWDNASWHRSKDLRDLLGEGNRFEKIHLVNLPAYAPDHNPIEHIWNEAKNQISNVQRARFEDTCHAFETFIRDNHFPYRL